MSANRPHTVALLLIAFMFCHVMPASAQKHAIAEASMPDVRAVRSVLGAWTHTLKSFRGDRRTIVFTTSLEGCSGCCASAVNDVLAEIERGAWDVNVVVLAETDSPEEVAAVRKLFKTPNVIADQQGKAAAALHAERVYPSMFMVTPGGTVDVRWIDIQHNLVGREVVNAFRWCLGVPRMLRPAWEVRLKESKENIVVNAYSASGDAHSVVFIDPQPNLIYRFSTVDGSLLSTYSVDDTVTFRFKRSDDNPRYWELMQQHVAPLVKLYAACPIASPERLRFLAMYHTGFDSSIMANGKQMVAFRKEMGVADLVGDKVSPITLLRIRNGDVNGTTVIDSTGNLVAQYVWDDGRTTLTNDVKRDSGFVLARSSVADSAFVPLVPIHELERSLGTTADPNLSVIPCAGRRDTLFFYDETNGVLARLTGPDRAVRVIPLWNCPALRPAMIAGNAGPSVPALPHDADTARSAGMPALRMLDDRSVTGLAWSGAYLDLVAIGIVGKRAAVSVRRILPDGTIIAEVAQTRDGDTPVEAYPIGYRDGCLMVLVKWKKARWIISGLRIGA